MRERSRLLRNNEFPNAVRATHRDDVSDPTARSDFAAGGADDQLSDLVHEWGLQSFPASDPPANW